MDLILEKMDDKELFFMKMVKESERKKNEKKKR